MLKLWQEIAFALLRIVFGGIWLVDAYFKWQPSFFGSFTSYLSGNLENQPTIVRDWIAFWIHLVGVNPSFFAFLVALAETAIALALIFGFFTRTAIWAGIAMSLVIWSTAEGFGGPYAAGSTDIGEAIIYVIVFVALMIGKCWQEVSVDAWLKKRKLIA
jgi:thiosulfate dehydrogenase (quinone) large subunit